MDLRELPEELLPTIFKYLPIDDRKNVRLTSQVWYDACNCFEIIRNEKFLIRFDPNKDNVAEIANGIVNCEKLRPNFEFHGFPLWQLPSSFVWERAKSAIESLYFYDCKMRESTISNIFLNCSNLRSFHLESNSHRRSLANLFGSEDALDDLIRRKFEQKKLRLLELFIPVHLTPKMYQKLYQIFPNIQTLGQGHLSSESEEGLSLELLPKIESFTDKELGGSTSWMVPFCNKSTNLKIKEVKTHLPSENYDKVFVHSFFSAQTELENLKLTLYPRELDPSNDVGKPLLLHILSSSPKLKEFKFNFLLYDIPLSITEFCWFLRQIGQLETLDLSAVLSVREYFISESLPKVKYTKLTKLRLQLSRNDEDIYSAILNRCTSSLRYLYLKGLPIDSTCNVLSMSKHWNFTELKTLRLEFWPTMREYRIGSFKTTCLPSLINFVKRLQNLEHLEIRGLERRKYRENKTALGYLEEFELPSSLKYFYFEMADIAALMKDACQLTDIISRKAPNLEILKLESRDTESAMESPRHVNKCLLKNTDLFVNYCRRMKKLKCLILSPFPADYHSFDDQHPMKQLFEACHSLKFVCGYSVGSKFIIVSYDRHSAKFKCYEENSKLETLEWFPKFGRTKKRLYEW